MKMSPKILSPSDQILAQTLLILIWAEMQLFEILELLYCMLYLIRPPTSFHTQSLSSLPWSLLVDSLTQSLPNLCGGLMNCVGDL